MQKILAFFRLVRWQNLLITALMMCLVYHKLIDMPSTIGFTLLVISMVLIQAGGYVINDIFDMAIDLINKPKKTIVGKIFTEKQSKIFYWLLTIIGLGCALASTLMMHGAKFITVFACMVLLAGVLYSYSKTYKKRLLIGNLIVSLSIAFAVFVPWLFVLIYMSKEGVSVENYDFMMLVSLRLVLIFTAFAFIMNLIREIVKDMQDVEGDSRQNCHTVPIVWGMQIAQIITLTLCAITFCGIQYAGTYINDRLNMEVASNILKWSSALLVFPMIIGLVMNLFSIKDNKPAYWFTPAFYSKALKISMLIGILSMFYIN